MTNSETAHKIAIKQILTPNRTLFGAHEDSKKRLFELISHTAVKDNHELDQKEIFEGLFAREKLGSTAIGHGVAIPHTRVAALDVPIATLILLNEAIGFDAQDNQPVDIFFGLLVPEDSCNDHLYILAHLAKLFQNDSNRRLVRAAGNSEALYKQIIDLSEALNS